VCAAASPSPSRLEHPDVDDLDLAAVLHALSDPTRLEIVRHLAACERGGELACGAISLPVTKATASHHFKVLRQAGVIAQRDEGTRRMTCLRRDDLERRFPGLLDSVLRAMSAEHGGAPSGGAARSAGRASR
jgi:DNA-binding transcriptional ArsR family regulator